MYDKYLIVAEALKNVQEGDAVTGYQFGLRLPYYRGVVLSLIGHTEIKVDGETVPVDQMTVTLHGKTFPMASLEDEPVEKWEFGEIGVVTVAKPGGLPAGDHRFELRQHMKISYVPGGFWGQDAKTIHVTN
jgi:hypothetical protein